MDTQIRMGRIQYKNVLPLFYSLENGITTNPFVLTYAPPAILNTMIRKGELDISPVSSIEYLQNRESYYLVKDFSISSKGAVKSVLLFSHIPIDNLDNKCVSLTEESNTSVALLKILLKERYGIMPQYISRKQSQEENISHDAILLIGDSALKESINNTYSYCYDIGTLWYEWTELPSIFAVWVIHKNNSNLSIISSIQALHEARAWGKQNMPIIYREAKENNNMTEKSIIEYYTLLRYSFGEEEERALYHFAFLLYKNNLLSKVNNTPFLYTP